MWHVCCSARGQETPNKMRAKTSMLSAAVVAALFVVTIPAGADSNAAVDLTPQFKGSDLVVDGLRAIEVGGIVVLRGKTVDPAMAERAGGFAQNLGYSRVANLIHVGTPPAD